MTTSLMMFRGEERKTESSNMTRRRPRTNLVPMIHAGTRPTTTTTYGMWRNVVVVLSPCHYFARICDSTKGLFDIRQNEIKQSTE